MEPKSVRIFRFMVVMVLAFMLQFMYLFQENMIESLQTDLEFMEWQAKEFSDLLKKNKIPHAWG